MAATARRATLPLLVTALVALAALAGAAWLVFFAASPTIVADEPTLAAPVQAPPAPMPKPAPPATAP